MPHPPPPPQSRSSLKIQNNQTGVVSCTLIASIKPDPFPTKQHMLDFLAKASEGIVARTEDGIEILIKI